MMGVIQSLEATTPVISEKESVLARLRGAETRCSQIHITEPDAREMKIRQRFFEHLQGRIREIIQELGRLDLRGSISDFRWLITRSGITLEDLGLDQVFYNRLRELNRYMMQ